MENKFNVLFGARIKELRTSKGISQKDFANKINVTSAMMCRIENGKVFTSGDVISKMCKVLNCRVVDLFNFNNDIVLNKEQQSYLKDINLILNNHPELIANIHKIVLSMVD